MKNKMLKFLSYFYLIFISLNFARSNKIVLLFIHICDVIKIKFLVHEETNIYIFNEKYINL